MLNKRILKYLGGALGGCGGGWGGRGGGGGGVHSFFGGFFKRFSNSWEVLLDTYPNLRSEIPVPANLFSVGLSTKPALVQVSRTKPG